MKFRYLIALTAALSVSATCFAADDGEALYKSKNCSACHQMAKKTLGPSVKDIAAKYAGDKEAPAKLEAKVRSGGAGSFGSTKMPEQSASKISDGDVKTVVSWILNQK